MVCVQHFSQKATAKAEVLGALLRVKPATSSADQVTEVMQCVMQCVTVPSSRVTDYKKNVYFFFKRCSDIFAKLCKPFELTLLPEEMVLLLVLILPFPSLSLLWVMGQQDLAAGDRVHNDFG